MEQILKKYKGYIILTVIFIIILTIVYFTVKGKVQYINVSVQDTAIMRRIDSIKYANTEIQERIYELEQKKEEIRYIIVNNKKDYENKIDSINNNNADSNYYYILIKNRYITI